ncbi:hypothetical protein [Microvirga sp. TS319]|uniref:hypothetical protein n=1 Tax=Microvirga sp. TS319 TaxID=3241165 RepID=UPI00351A97FD
MLSRRKLFGFLAAAPVVAAAGPVLARGGPVKGRSYVVGEVPSETVIPLKNVELRHPTMVRPVTITVNNTSGRLVRMEMKEGRINIYD